jgi:tetratricopeptide (TPR) repeat protein
MKNEEMRVGLAAAALAFFFTHGLPLWNDDYYQWLAQAHAEGAWGDLFKRLLLPLTAEPQTWGYSDRPVLVLLYKFLAKIFGFHGTGFYLVKSLAFGGLCAALYRWMRQLGAERLPAFAALALFAVSANVTASLVYLSDFGVLSQLVLVAVLAYAVPQIEKGPSGVSVYENAWRKGWDALPAPFLKFLGVFFAAVYIGSKLRGEVRLAPVILLAWLAIYRREKLKTFAAPFVLTFLATLPWSRELFRHLPPFLGGAGYSGWTYSTFDLSRVFEFLARDAFVLRAPPLSVIGGFGILAAVAMAAYGAYRLKTLQEETPAPPGEKTGLLLVWLGTVLLALGTIGRQNPTFQLRYTLAALVPATLLAALAFSSAWSRLGGRAWFRPTAFALIVAQCALSALHGIRHRIEMGRTMITVDRMYRTVEERYPSASFVYAPGFLPYAYRRSAAPALQNRRSLGTMDEAAQLPAGQTYVASWSSTLDARFVVDTPIAGCGANLFDAIFSCGPGDGAMLLRYVGAPGELAQADQLDKQGNLAAARGVLEGYLRLEPGNHGAAFVLSLLYYRLKDFAAMERVYESIGPYFTSFPSVVYNWALAKQGLQKLKDAVPLFEHAYRIVPGDYGIGFNLADTYYRLGKRSRALATLRELMKSYPQDATMRSVYQDWERSR